MADLDFSRMFSGASPVLAGLAPIPVVNLAAGGQLDFRPLSAVNAVSAHPEAVAMGLGQGIENVAKGYLAAVQQKKQDAKEEAERKRKADLEERRMKVEEGKFGMEKDKLAKEYQDRLAAVGADKFPGENGAGMAPQRDEAAPSTVPESSAAKVSSSGLPLIGTVFPTSAYTGETAPFQKEKYTREANTFRFNPEEANYTPAPDAATPASNVQILPKPLSSNLRATPAAPVTPQVSDTSVQRPADGIPKNRAQELIQRGFTPAPGDENLPPTNEVPIKTAYNQVANWFKKGFQEIQSQPPVDYSNVGLKSLLAPQKTEIVGKPVEKPVADKTAPVVSPQASYQYPADQWDRLQQATTGNLKELSPYLTASAETGDVSTDKTPALPPTLPVPEQKKQLYPLDLSKMYNIQYTEEPKAMEAQQQKPAPAVAQPTERFGIPERPTATQIPKDFATRDYNAARAEQAKDYGFYYEPMGRIETHQDANGQWYKVVRDPEKASILEQKMGRLETMRQRYDKYKLQEQNTIDREQSKFYSNPDVRAFTAPNGMRQSFSRFVKDYDAILKNPEASGISDIGLLDMFGRAEGGGRITEGQAALALRAVGILDKPEQLIQKLQGGARLSQNQRDQMMRVIAEDHAAQASLANQQIEMVRQKLQRQGITDETMLPQPYILPITKWDYEAESKQARALNTQLQLQKTEAVRNNDTATVDQINQQLSQLQEKMDPIYKMAKRAQKDKDGNIIDGILNAHEIEHTPQGWAGGAVTTFQQQEP